MKTRYFTGLFLSLLFLFACNSNKSDAMLENYKLEIIKAEADFAQMAKEKGILEAFLAFADENAVLKRGNQIVKGKKEIKAYFEAQSVNYKDMKLMWKPDFVDVSSSGDLAYTYGGFTSKVLLNDSSVQDGSGIFHTVWKRQEDGSWKYVWD